MPRRPCPRAVALENQAFLRHLRATGNAHEAARRLGVSRTRFTKRRAKDPNFATEWDQALVFADATLKSSSSSPREGGPPPTVVRTASGKTQLRRPGTAKLTRDHEQRFLLALSATANVRLASAAAGLSHATFYARKRRSKAFAREWRAALAQGYDRVETACLAAETPDAYRHDDWTHNDPPELPPMSWTHAIQLLQLHQKEARLLAEPDYLKRRRGESREAHSMSLGAMRAHRDELARETFRRAEALRQINGRDNPYHRLVLLPDLAVVDGWSKSDPTKQPHHAERALFGGWRLRDWRERDEGEG